MTWKTKGMNRDLSVSAFNPEFSFENYNLRLSTNEGNTTLSWVNERSTKKLELSIYIPYFPYRNRTPGTQPYTATAVDGVPIGTAVINHQLVLFTTFQTEGASRSVDSIYVLYLEGAGSEMRLCGKRLFIGWLNFDLRYPLETFVSYEAEHIQKVYWTDGLNQPRVINIAAPEEHIKRWHCYGGQYIDIYKDPLQPDTFFDFVPSFYTDESVEIRKNETGGMFQPGVIQYCFTYFNKYGQQSNIVYVSPLYYLSLRGGGQDPEKTVTNSFHITISNTDRYNFDYIRLYSIQRIAIDTAPIVRRIVDLPVPKTYNDAGVTDDINYTDTGIAGGVIDAMELQYVGGKEIAVLTMAEKDNTLFMGNITEKNILVNKIQDYFYAKWKERLADNKSQTDLVRFAYYTPKKTSQPTLGFYSYKESLDKDAGKVTTFKGGDYYRFGFQLQKYTGEWTEPIFIGDRRNEFYPYTTYEGTKLSGARYGVPIIEDNKITGYTDGVDWSVFTSEEIDGRPNPYYIEGFYQKYKKVRPLIVYPNMHDREVVCQGVLNPTVFNVEDRVDNSPYAQPSWYFRPYVWQTSSESAPVSGNTDQSYFSGKTKEVRLLFGILPDSILIAVKQRGYINLDKDNGGTSSRCNFSGIIVTNSQDSSRVEVAIVFEGWVPNMSGTQEYRIFDGGDKIQYADSIDPNNYWVRLTPAGGSWVNPLISAQMYNGLDKTILFEYEYKQKTSQAPIKYVLEFYNPLARRNENITYETIGVIQEGGRIVVNGSTLEYRHYHSIPSVNLQHPMQLGVAKNVEIEGSEDKYGSILSGSDHDDVTSNTQFFIDQSILTLNSPDLEYDEGMQNYSSKDLELNIIGVIPITGVASSHSITSGSMMETNHGVVGGSHELGAGDLRYNIYKENRDLRAGQRLVSEYLWNDTSIYIDSETGEVKSAALYDYLVYPWQAEGSLVSDPRPSSSCSSRLDTKKESNTLFSLTTLYRGVYGEDPYLTELGYVSMEIHLRENSDVYNKQLTRNFYVGNYLDYEEKDSKQLNYYPNIDKLLYNKNGYTKKTFVPVVGSKMNNPVKMRYNSNTHAIITSHRFSNSIFDGYTIPGTAVGKDHTSGIGKGALCNVEAGNSTLTFWGENESFHQSEVDLSTAFITESSNRWRWVADYAFLWLGELTKKKVENRFGGSSIEALRANEWHIAGKASDIKKNSLSPLEWVYGDTYFQRYDCLKTYCRSEEDSNQVVEILSFMCETHINLDGRYDNKRGQWKNHNVVPENYVKLNDVYSQQDNFFTYKQTDNSDLKGEDAHYPNHITYSKTKETGEDIDTYANVTLASILELDGDKGKIRSIRKFNDSLIVFQDSAISQIQYNENVQIASTAGVPIEIANSGKVRGYRYLSDSIGCDNKWSIVNTPLGLYFMSSLNKGIYRIGNQLENLSQQKGFTSWCSRYIPEISKEEYSWMPMEMYYYTGYYDRQNQDVLFVNDDWCLAFSERVGEFTSFYGYNGIPFFCNLDNTSLWITQAGDVFEHRGGDDYCNLFGEYKGYYMTLVANAEPQRDKIFTNMEFRATVEGEGETDVITEKYEPYIPFNHIHTWNEYQNGSANLKHFKGIPSMRHYKDAATALERKSTALKRKFRIWRCDIPRDSQHKMDRMRNPWQYIKLWHKSGVEWDKSNGKKVEIHDVQAVYFV